MQCGAELPAQARFCLSCGAPVRPVGSREERKLATVLFADPVGSTELGGSQDPERTRAMLDRFYEGHGHRDRRRRRNGREVCGRDAVSVFGAPHAQEDHAERALHAALAMRRRLAELFEGSLQLRIGVNSGEVVVGAAREGGSFVTGDTVNVCARLEQNAEAGKILAGERTVARRVAHEGEPHLVTIMGDAGVGKSRLVVSCGIALAANLSSRSEEPAVACPTGTAAAHRAVAHEQNRRRELS